MMKKLHFNTLCVVLSILLVALLGCVQSIPIAKYQSQTADETAIHKLLIDREEAFRTENAEVILAQMHENGRFKSALHLVLSKEEWAETLPDIFKLTPGQTFENLRIKVNGSEANALFIASTSTYKIEAHLDLVKENGKWLIKLLQYR